MPQSTLEIIANAAQARSTVNAFSNDLRNLEQQALAVQRALQGITAKALGRGQGGIGGTGGVPGALVEPTTAALTNYGKALEVTSRAQLKLANGMTLMGAEFKTFHGNIDEINKANNEFKNVLDRQTQSMDRIAGGSLPAAKEQYGQLSKAIGESNFALNGSGTYIDKTTGRWANFNNVIGGTNSTIRDYVNLQERITKAEAKGASFAPQVARADARLTAAFDQTPALPFAYDQLNKISPQLLRKLQGLGLGGGNAFGTEGFAQNIADSGGYKSLSINKDLVNNLTQVQGRFKDTAGFVNTFTAQIDKSGNVITKFGGRLSGISNILGQIGRDFQKVAEYAIATTTIFAAYQAASKEIGNIIALDKSLAQVGVTANLSTQDTHKLFGSIADIAYQTATPLKELVAATDDAALATRQAGQSTEQWQHQTLSLINSVGILTNLTGKDTVSSADLLTSAMKQLNLQADELPSILNKIAAVAGGQSTAIADITQGLGVMAEAGKQAGLTVDQMIATVQTLSQVTAKSPDEVATAFKNLVGSLTSAGSIKALEKYGISVKDSVGNIRNILDVYTEINKKITSGAIAPGNVQQLTKAIAGGPRRAPDAAALLGAVGSIGEVTQKSIGASNEALIANQKILDTTASKLVQIGVLFEKFAFSKFADALKGAVNEILTLVTVVLQFVNGLPASVVSTTLKFLGIAVALKVIGSGFTFLKGIFSSFNLDLLNTGAELTKIRAGLQETAAAQKALAVATEAGTVVTKQFGIATEQGTLLENTNSSSINWNTKAKLQNIPATVEEEKVSLLSRAGVGAIFNSVKGSIGSSLLLGGITAGATLASNPSNTGEAASQFLQGAGISLVAQAPLPQLKLIGAALAAVGFVTEALSNNTKKETDAMAENAQAVLANVKTYTDAKQTVEDLNTAQATLELSMGKLNKVSKLSVDQQRELKSNQSDYADNTIKLVNANNSLIESYNKLKESIPKDELNQFSAAQHHLLGADALQAITLKATASFLSKTNPELVPPGAFNLPSLNVGNNSFTATGSTKITGSGLSFGSPGNPFGAPDLTQLENTPASVQDLFSNGIFGGGGKQLVFDKTAANFDLIGAALDKMKGQIPDKELATMVASLTEAAAQSDSLAQLSNNLTVYSQYIAAESLFGTITADQADKLTKLENFYGGTSASIINSTSLSNAQPNQVGGVYLPGEQGPPDLGTKEGAQRRLTQLTANLNGTGPGATTKQDFLDWATILDKANGKQSTFSQLQINAQHIARALGVEVHGLTDVVLDLGAAIKQAGDEFYALHQQSLTDLASRNAGLLQQLHSGSLKPSEFKALFAESEAAYASTNKLGKSLTYLQNVNPTRFADFESVLTKIPGLEDAVGLSATELTARFTGMLINMGLTAAQARKFTADILDLSKVSGALADAKLLLHVDVDVHDAIIKLKALIQTYEDTLALFGGAADKLPGHQNAGGYIDAKLKRALDDLSALEKANKSTTSVKKLIYDLTHGSLGGPKGTTGSGLNVSTLDVPANIEAQTNDESIIKQAIANAKKLRNQIPGETKKDKNDIVELLDGTKKVAEVRGVSEELLRKALDELSKKIQKQIDLASKADIIQRIRVGSGSFAALANVPLNSLTGASVGGPSGPVSINLNINGQVLTPAQFDNLANLIAAALKKQIGGGG